MGVRLHLVVFGCLFLPSVGGEFFNFSMEVSRGSSFFGRGTGQKFTLANE